MPRDAFSGVLPNTMGRTLFTLGCISELKPVSTVRFLQGMIYSFFLNKGLADKHYAQSMHKKYPKISLWAPRNYIKSFISAAALRTARNTRRHQLTVQIDKPILKRLHPTEGQAAWIPSQRPMNTAHRRH